jgi:subtilisin family serine protease
MSDFKEYIVTTSSLEDTDSVWDDLVSDNTSSNTVPNRSVEVSDERAINQLNTNYLLTEEEAEALKNDPRVVDVFDPSSVPVTKFAFQDSNFSKTTGAELGKGNWGLLRHTNTTNVFGTSTADPGGTYDYVLDGTGVDVVILDSGIQADHPEWQDAQGNSRLQQIDWFAASGVPGTMPANFYTDYDGHGTHVAGTVAGKTFGWAKNARIYAIKLNDLKGAPDPGNGLSIAQAFDVLLGWHQAKNNTRPTVINNSWGYSIFWRTNDNAFSFSFSGGTTYAVNGGTYRGTPWTGSVRDTAKGHTGASYGNGVYGFPYKVSSTDADIAQLIAAGVVVCNAAGNDSVKADILGGIDYDNSINLTGFGTFYYHRKGSPTVGTSFGFDVGSLGSGTFGGLDTKSSFSNSGPAITLYAAGSRILSAMSETNDGATSFPYNENSNFKQDILGGTSMASPQVAGLAALVLQAHPDWTPSQVVRWMISKSQAQLRDTGLTNDYAVSTALHGGNNRVCYMPMKGQRPFTFTEV